MQRAGKSRRELATFADRMTESAFLGQERGTPWQAPPCTWGGRGRTPAGSAQTPPSLYRVHISHISVIFVKGTPADSAQTPPSLYRVHITHISVIFRKRCFYLFSLEYSGCPGYVFFSSTLPWKDSFWHIYCT
jgi:hypothetical protein